MRRKLAGQRLQCVQFCARQVRPVLRHARENLGDAPHLEAGRVASALVQKAQDLAKDIGPHQCGKVRQS